MFVLSPVMFVKVSKSSFNSSGSYRCLIMLLSFASLFSSETNLPTVLSKSLSISISPRKFYVLMSKLVSSTIVVWNKQYCQPKFRLIDSSNVPCTNFFNWRVDIPHTDKLIFISRVS